MTHNFILRLCYTDVYNVTIDGQGPVVFLWITVMRAYLPPPIYHVHFKEVECVDHIPL